MVGYRNPSSNEDPAPQSEALIPVRPELRIVPAGGDATKLKATVLLSPLPLPDNTASSLGINLQNWPSDMASFLWGSNGETSFHVMFEKITVSEKPSTSCLPAPCPGLAKAIQLKVDVPRAKAAFGDLKRLDRILSLWRSSITRKPSLAVAAQKDPWTKLGESLAKSSKADIELGYLSDENGAVGVEVNYDEGSLGTQGQLKVESDTNAKIHSVLAVPHADLALTLDQKRAAELLTSLSCEVDLTDPGATGSRPTDPDKFGPISAEPGMSPSEAAKHQHEADLEVYRRKRLNDLQDRLKGKREQAKTDYSSAKAALERTHCLSPDDAPRGFSGVTPNDIASRLDEDDRIKAASAIEEHGTWPQHASTGKDDDLPLTTDHASEAFFTLQSTPSLSRAFLLAVDLTIEFTEKTADGFPSPFDKKKPIFGFLSVSLPGLAETERMHTLCKLEWRGGTTDDPEDGHWHFWPATTVEVHAAVMGCPVPPAHALTQRDGVIVMSGGWDCEPGKGLPRFDLTCLDLPAAITSNRQRRLATEDSKVGPFSPSADEPDREPWADLKAGATLATAGLTLLQRSAQQDVIAKLAARKMKSAGKASGAAVTCGGDGCMNVVLDADDLTVGFRIAAGRREGENKTDWRPLMGRQICFGNTGDKENRGAVESLLAELIGTPTSAPRIALDSAYTTLGNRLLPLPEARSEVIVDEAIATWDGGPMGVDCSQSSNTDVDIEDTLSFGREFSLPDRGDDRPHMLRYGQPYRFAMLPVYSGGQSLQMREMPQDQKTSETDLARLYYFPPACHRADAPAGQEPFFRMLRHARINAPVVLLPAGHARRVNGTVGAEAARDIVIRSLAKDDRKGASRQLASRAVPELAQRLILPPTLSFEEAARHGLFDNRTSEVRPSGAYRGIRQDATNQSFPVTITRFQKGVGGRQHFLDRLIEGEKASDRLDDGSTSGDSVWANRGGNGPSAYYPDPAARYLAVQLRVPGQAKAIEKGFYDLWVGAKPKPEAEARPILLSLVKPKGKTARLLPEDKNLKLRRINPERQDDIRGNTGREVFDLEIKLAAGQIFDLDLWWVPDGGDFARDFALVQSLGVHLAAAQCRTLSCSAEHVCATLTAKGLDEIAQQVSVKDEEKPCGTNGFCYVAPGGVAAPSNGLLKKLGRAIETIHKSRPLPEISAVHRLTLTHAVNRPEATEAPQIAEETSADPFLLDPPPIPVPVDAKDPVPLYARRYRHGLKGAAPDSFRVAETEGETGLVIGGEVLVDLDLVSSLEVWAKVVLPDSDLFDNKALGRSLPMQQSGTWPTALQKSGSSKNTGSSEVEFRKASSIFGFDVFVDGRVEHKARDIRLLRIDDLPFANGAGPQKLDLLPYFLQGKSDGGKDSSLPGRVVHRHQFPDGKARVMQVSVKALSRTANRMATIDRLALEDDPWVDPARSFGFILGDLVESAPLDAKDQGRDSVEPVRVVMPASVRPLACDARSPIPVFSDDKLQCLGSGKQRYIVAKRRARVRLPLGRGWYSSGEDEMLGIVLWPPLPLGVKSRPGGATLTDRGMVPLVGFRDSDLGPGGRFVSRRGGDPVRAGTGEEHHLFLDGTDFLAIGIEGGPLGYEECVLMPLELPANEPPATKDDDGGQSKSDSKKLEPPPPMLVSLATARPRFDPEREEWYVDLDIIPGDAPDAFVRLGLVRYQPHSNPARRCSVPTVQWAQPLPDRTVIVGPIGEEGLLVKVLGTAPSRRSNDEVVYAKMTLTIISETLDSEGRSIKREVERCEITQPRNVDGPAQPDRWQWTGQVSLNTLANAVKPLRAGETPKVFIYVEETETFLPATYGKEPVLKARPEKGATDGPAMVATGPRFAQMIPLKELLDDTELRVDEPSPI